MYQRLAFLILIVFFPIHQSLAIPPPDLIISTAQAVLTTFGLIVGSIIILWKQLKDYAASLGPKRIIFYVFILVFPSSLIYISSNIATIHTLYWRYTIDAELREVWKNYEPIYSAENEVLAREEKLTHQYEITWADFMKVSEGQEYLVIDIREAYGFNAGKIPGSVHLRFGDLINGGWKTLLPYKDTPMFIVCYVGSTGAMTIDFLEKRGFSKLYQPVNGILAAKRAEPDLPIEGNLETFGKRFINKFATKKALDEGAITIDMRSPEHYSQNVPFTVNYRNFREFMTTTQNDKFLKSLPKDKTYLPFCDSVISCYQGEILLIDLEKAGYSINGVYDITK